tara:strand:- start:497 stop:670 length:174 start_codon:yes stop_codon:yes gene_type:complete
MPNYSTGDKPKHWSISKSQMDRIMRAARGVWYYETYFRIALLEDKHAGKSMRGKGKK